MTYQIKWNNGYWKMFNNVTFSDERIFYTLREALDTMKAKGL